MKFFNVYGLVFVAVIMIPNIVFAVKCKDGFENKWDNRYVQIRLFRIYVYQYTGNLFRLEHSLCVYALPCRKSFYFAELLFRDGGVLNIFTK